jgi:hypothetical protein
LTHRIVPKKGGKGSHQANITYSVLEEYKSVDSLEAILVDNTKVNTGHLNGLCICLERKLKRKLHMIGCFLHMNELPLRHIIRKLDGETISGNKLSGDVGKLLDADELYQRDPVQFVPVPTQCKRPNDTVLEDLSEDQRLLLEYTLGIASGKIAERFQKRKPGPLNHSRWLTTATRILILYTRTEEPSETLKILVTFIVQIYAPVWFMVKHDTNFTEILFGFIQGVKEIEPTSQKFTKDIVF